MQLFFTHMKDAHLFHLSNKQCSDEYIDKQCALSFHWEACQVQQHAVTTLEHSLLQALSVGILPSSEARRNLRCRTIGGSQPTWFDSL